MMKQVPPARAAGGSSVTSHSLHLSPAPLRAHERLPVQHRTWQWEQIMPAVTASARPTAVRARTMVIPHALSERVKGFPQGIRVGRVQLIQPVEPDDTILCDKLLVYLPGTDGTGQAILPQVEGLRQLGYDVWCLYIPYEDRSDWEQLTTQVTLLLRQLLQNWRGGHPGAAPSPPSAAASSPETPAVAAAPRITVVGESFGCCLALRLAASSAGPELLDRLVLLNSATSFNRSLSGLSALIAATNLLSMFPRDLYSVAQTTLLPLLIDSERVEERHQHLLRSMILMEAPASRQGLGFGAASAPAPGSGAGSSGSASDWDTGGSALTQTGPRSGGNSSSRSSSSSTAAGGGGSGTLYYGPAAAANFRTNLLRDGEVDDAVLARVAVPTLLLCSARDRLLPSIVEGARLERLLPRSRRVILPDSGHAALLERGVSLAALMRGAGFAGAGSSGSGSGEQLPAARIVVTAAGPPVGQVVGVGQRQQPEVAAGTAESGSGGRVAAVGAGQAEVAGAAGPGGVAPGSSAVGAARTARRRDSGGSGAGSGSSGSGSDVEGADKGVVPPDDSAFDEWCQKLSPWRELVSPVVLGSEHLPAPGSPLFSRPMLFVGNHQKMGFYDTPLLVYELYVRGYRVRGLAHPGHWAGPFGKWFEQFGAVKASPMAAFRLLKGGEKVLLFPGGAKEVVKKRGQEYTLLWRESPDFVRLAAKCNALIVPFAAVGADDAYDVIMDTDEVVANPVLGPLLKGVLSRVSEHLNPEESIFPITRLPVVGLPTPIPVPNLQRLYFKFAPPVDPRALGTDIRNAQQVQELYDGVRETVSQAMSELLEVRAADDGSQLSARLGRSLAKVVPQLVGAGAAAGAEAANEQQQQPQQQQ